MSGTVSSIENFAVREIWISIHIGTTGVPGLGSLDHIGRESGTRDVGTRKLFLLLSLVHVYFYSYPYHYSEERRQGL